MEGHRSFALYFAIFCCLWTGTHQDKKGYVRLGSQTSDMPDEKSDNKAGIRPEHGCRSLLVMKLAETGSTWFASLLQNTQAYTVKKEIYTSKDQRIPVVERERVMESYLNCEPKLHVRTPVVGFTVNPKNNPDVHWAELVKSVKHGKTYVVRWHRSNVVKTAISAYRKSHMNCGGNEKSHNMNNIMIEGSGMDEGYVECLRAPTIVDFKGFVKTVAHQAGFYSELEKAFIQASSQLDASKSLTMYYEDMEEDEGRQMRKLAEFLGNALYYKAPKDGTAKKTSNDLRDAITNYNELLKGVYDLNVPASLKCPLVDMFTSVGFEKYIDCDYAGLRRFLLEGPHFLETR